MELEQGKTLIKRNHARGYPDTALTRNSNCDSADRWRRAVQDWRSDRPSVD
jgi:hypothetical protein